MNDFTRAADISDAVGAFFADGEFREKIKGLNLFNMVGMMLRDYPDKCMNLICAYHGIDKEAQLDAKDIYSKMVLAYRGCTEVFQFFE